MVAWSIGRSQVTEDLALIPATMLPIGSSGYRIERLRGILGH